MEEQFEEAHAVLELANKHGTFNSYMQGLIDTLRGQAEGDVPNLQSAPFQTVLCPLSGAGAAAQKVPVPPPPPLSLSSTTHLLSVNHQRLPPPPPPLQVRAMQAFQQGVALLRLEYPAEASFYFKVQSLTPLGPPSTSRCSHSP
jgi:hypothetical protein